ncbi:MAG: ABC-three component system protein [Bacteroidota bacterium]
MRYNYHDLYNHQFEDLVVAICKYYLGMGVQEFSTGPDGGRDAKFVGTANAHTSKSNPLSGQFIIQAKHTENPVAKVSDKDFSSNRDDSVIEKEKKRLKKLIAQNEVEHYIMFTNRREGANKIVELQDDLESLGLESAYIFGIKNTDRFLKVYSEAVELADINEYQGPLRVVPDDLAKIISRLKNELKILARSDNSETNNTSMKRAEFKKKNKLNGVSEELAEFIIRNYISTFDKIDQFLAAPVNEDYQELYIETAQEFNAEILERLSKGDSMDALLNNLIYRLKTRDGDLKTNKRLTRATIYYMYWKCDLGIDEEVENVNT